MTKIKICGLTQKKDALLACSLGAYAVGFVFAPSPRQVSPEQVGPIIAALPAQVLSVGVFVDENLSGVLKVVRQLGLKAVQLHGRESAAYITQLKKSLPHLFVIKSIGVEAKEFLLNPHDYECCDSLLFDTTTPRNLPGPRPQIDWSVIANKKWPRPFFVAGGLRPDNVAYVIKAIKPDGVDVSSGVEFETRAGIKSESQLKAFFRSVGESPL